MKKIRYLLFGFLYILYFIAIVTTNNWIGDILSPIITLLTCYYVFRGFFIYEKNNDLKAVSLFVSIGLLFWFLSDIIWGIYSLVLNSNPDEVILITYGYFATNLFFLAAFLILSYSQLRVCNKIQAIWDAVIIFICIMALIWVFVFDQDINNIKVLQLDTISMLSMIIDIVIYIFINIWYFSIRKKGIPIFMRLFITGAVLYVYVDFIYYYQYFYKTYQSNSWVDGLYMLSFTLMAIGSIIKMMPKKNISIIPKSNKAFGTYRRELLFLAVPLLLVIFKGTNTSYLFFLILCILLYYIVTFYTQNSILKDELLQKEKEHVRELEDKVKDRTQEIEKLLNTDIITGLYSRRYFEKYLSGLCETIEKQENIVLLYIEQNKCKNITVTYEKYSLDSLVKEVGRRINEIAQQENGLLASYGDNVFTLLLRGSYSYEQGLNVAKRIIHHCSDLYYLEGQDVLVTMNIGISCYPMDCKDFHELIKNADTAMVLSRKIGYNKALEYNKKLGEHLYFQNEIDMKLKKIKYDEVFKLYFQPQVRCEDGELIGFEALIRWQTEDGKFIPPYEFIPIAEENGVIVPLGYWILEQAALQVNQWKTFTSLDVRMAINVSVKQLNDRKFVAKLERILKANNVLPQNIEIEITENMQLEKNISMIETLRNIRNMGISIAVDDFGTGYSSLYYLKNLPINRIKIAKELIDNIEKDTYDYTIVKMAIQIAKSRGIKTIAEGVETKDQWMCLKELDCDEIQGYYFGKPMPEEDIMRIWGGLL